MEKRAIVISKESYDELKHLAIKTDKFLYQLIDECITIIKEKYNEHRDNISR
jgi:hypothetical protein